MQLFKKRPGLTWMLDVASLIPTTAQFIDAVAISALYNIVVAAFINGTTAYIVQINVNTNATVLVGTFTVTGTADFIWLSETSQASGGNLYPGLAVNYMNSAFTTSASYYAVATTGAFATSSLTAITDVNFPNKQTPALITIGKFIFKNGSNYIATLDGRIYNSTSGGNDISTWISSTGVGSINVNQYPDQCLGLERYKQNLVAFGTNSIEFFEDVGTVPCPLTRLDQAFIKIGVVSPKTYINVDDIIYWIGYSSDNAVGLWKLDGYQASKVSVIGIDQLLINSFSTTSNTGFSSGIMRGKKCLFISPIEATPTLPQAIGGALSQLASQNWSDTSFGSLNPDYGCIALNLDDNLWWEMNGNFLLAQSTFFVLPTFNAIATNPLINQIVFSRPVVGPSTIVYSVDISDDDQANYWDTIDGAGTVQLYPTFIITNQVRFGNNKNKRIDQLVVNRESYTVGFHLPTAQKNLTYGGILVAMRQPWNINALDIPTVNYGTQGGKQLNLVPVDTAVIPYTLPPTAAGRARMSFNRLGTGRSWSFMYIEFSPGDFVTSGYELMAQQYQH
jgi:hypothetical protein